MRPTTVTRSATATGATVDRRRRIGVIGVGRIGRMHAELLSRRVSHVEVAAIVDADAPSARAVGDELGLPVAASVESLLADENTDAVAICANTATHAELVIAAAEAGKAIFCEKPVSLELADLDRALAAVEKAGVPFQIGFNRRFDPAHRSVHDAVMSGAVGDPHLVRITSRDPAPPPLEYVRTSGGLFLDMTIHDFDMARFVSGSEVVEVYARGAVRIDPAFANAGDVDTAMVVLVHDSGCLTAIDNSRQSVYGYDQRVEVFGSAGAASSENPLAHSGLLRTAQRTHAATLHSVFVERYARSYVREWEAFVAALCAGATPPVTAADARPPLVIGLAALRSLVEGRPVRVEEVEAG